MVRQEALILDLRDVQKDDILLVGGKALNLGLMMKAGFLVPEGFVITTNAFKASVRPSGQIEIPEPVKEEILSAYRERGFQHVAVRSSATLEDLSRASFAGVYASSFNIGSEEELLQAVEDCFRSLRTPRSDFYRQSMGIEVDEESFGMAVVVQEMIDAEAAGVMYTLDPITFNQQELLINSVFGLGEPLASGKVPGDVFRVERSGCILEQVISEKSSMLTVCGEVSIRGEERDLPSLTPQQISTLVEKGLEIERLFGTPQDIEFAFANRDLCILQARPIPVHEERLQAEIERYRRREIERLRGRIAELRRRGKLSCDGVVFSNGNIGELLPTPTPMSFGIFTYIFADEGGIQIGRRQMGYILKDETSEGLFELICGHPYFNLEIDARTFHVGFPLDVQGYIDKVREDPELANYPELGLYEQELTLKEAISRFGPEEGRRYHERFLEFLGRMTEYGRGYLDRFSREVEPELQRYLERERNVDLAALSSREIIDKIHFYLEHLRTFSCVHFVIAARFGFFFVERIKKKISEWFPQEAGVLVGELLRGLEGSKIGQLAVDFAKLADSETSQEAFLAMYGHLATHELEISLPRIADDPKVLEQLMRESQGSMKDPKEEFERQVARRRKAEEGLRKRFEQMHVDSPVVQEFFEEFKNVQRYLPLRETIKYYLAAEYAFIRKALIVLAKRFNLNQEEIFYLYPTEIPELLSNFKKAKEKASQRKEERRLALFLAKQKRMPKVIFESRLEEIGTPMRIEASREFTGIPVSSGEAVGIVRTLEPEELDFTKVMDKLGDAQVIVTRAATLGMLPLVRKAAGLVMETGGILAHGACLARESGIPAVVLENATVLLPDGSMVKIDGNSGKVSLLESPVDPRPPLPRRFS